MGPKCTLWETDASQNRGKGKIALIKFLRTLVKVDGRKPRQDALPKTYKEVPFKPGRQPRFTPGIGKVFDPLRELADSNRSVGTRSAGPSVPPQGQDDDQDPASPVLKLPLCPEYSLSLHISW